MNNHIPIDHFRYKIIPEVAKINDDLHESLDYINFMGYGCQYDNGAGLDIVTNIEWADHYWQKYLFDQNNIKYRLKSGINFWKRNSFNEITIIQEDARDNFDIDARIEFIYRDNLNKCYHNYSFASNKKNADRAYAFYDIHRGKLLKFITCFKQKASHLILESNKPENLILIPNYSIDHTDNLSRRDYAMELQRENPNTKITDREFEIMLIYAAGYTTKNIAEMLNKSEKTIETHLHNIREKYALKDRVAMKKYLMAQGHSGLEQFFFSYLPDKSH